ncbi:MAG: helix-turn-helix transcriptional regulator [Clostridiales Family XIII bacterium]|nr:helix-turn-helix domain-containing protein [Clostridia bacterium]MDY3010890.1 helix-turn-helix transcriptional regulator [Clostridiales Family XIII bacterium]
MGIGKNLKRILQVKNMTVAELSRSTDISPQTFYAIIKRDSNKVKTDTLIKIAKALNVSTEELMGIQPNEFNFRLSIGSKIQQIRQNQEVSLLKLAEMTGISAKKLRMYESNETLPTYDELIKISECLEVDVYLTFASIFENYEIEKGRERKLLDNYFQLNYEGRSEAIKRVEELTHIEKYTEEELEQIDQFKNFLQNKHEKKKD